MTRDLMRLSLVVALAMGLSACEGFRKQLGLEKQSPDEFKVVSRAPLTVPPDFSLRPPDPGAPRPQVGTPTDQAREALTGVSYEETSQGLQGTQSANFTAGETSLLESAGALQVDGSIRRTVDRESDRINEESQDFIQALIFWRKEDPPGVVLDAEGESRRLQENATLGRSVTDGATPTIERKEKALFEGIF